MWNSILNFILEYKTGLRRIVSSSVFYSHTISPYKIHVDLYVNARQCHLFALVNPTIAASIQLIGLRLTTQGRIFEQVFLCH